MALSRATITAVGLTCKTFLNIGFCSIVVNGLPILMHALENENRDAGVVTISNHISTLDDPVTWGVLPARYYLRSRTTRWTLGASDIMFTNPVFSAFFRHGQTFETVRGKGIYQPAVDAAIAKLDRGGWVHLYGEGKVNQPGTYSKGRDGITRLPRFKWGVGRILMETSVPPLVIPMWLTGFDTLMPEGRAFPYKYFPRPGARLSVSFGNPIPADEIRKALRAVGVTEHSDISNQQKLNGWLGDQGELDETVKIRAEVTAIVHRRVESLGRSISGNSLSNHPP